MPQISLAYSAMVLSELNLPAIIIIIIIITTIILSLSSSSSLFSPLLAMLWMAISAQRAWSLYTADTMSWLLM